MRTHEFVQSNECEVLKERAKLFLRFLGETHASVMRWDTRELDEDEELEVVMHALERLDEVLAR